MWGKATSCGCPRQTSMHVSTPSINATNVTLNYGGTSETITITDPGGGQTTVDSTAGEMTTFNNPTATLTINAGGGTDTVHVNGLATNYPASVVIDGPRFAAIELGTATDFAIWNVPPGAYTLSAHARQNRISQPTLKIEARKGEIRSDVVLRLGQRKFGEV